MGVGRGEEIGVVREEVGVLGWGVEGLLKASCLLRAVSSSTMRFFKPSTSASFLLLLAVVVAVAGLRLLGFDLEGVATGVVVAEAVG